MKPGLDGLDATLIAAVLFALAFLGRAEAWLAIRADPHNCPRDDSCTVCQRAIDEAEANRDWPYPDDAPRSWEP